MAAVTWGIIGPGTIAHNFADGLAQATSGRLVAIASRDAGRRATFGDAYAIAADKRYATYADLLADPQIDAIYVSTPHPWHAELSIAALRAGKAVLCEKPGGLTASEVIAVTEVAAATHRFYMEAFMYRCHPQIARVLAVIAAGEIGQAWSAKVARSSAWRGGVAPGSGQASESTPSGAPSLSRGTPSMRRQGAVCAVIGS